MKTPFHISNHLIVDIGEATIPINVYKSHELWNRLRNIAVFTFNCYVHESI